jgi:hypothetical protein
MPFRGRRRPLRRVTDQAIEACGGDLLQAVKALIVANAMPENELADVYAKARRRVISAAGA